VLTKFHSITSITKTGTKKICHKKSRHKISAQKFRHKNAGTQKTVTNIPAQKIGTNNSGTKNRQEKLDKKIPAQIFHHKKFRNKNLNKAVRPGGQVCGRR
jgi:hypothetical protein